MRPWKQRFQPCLFCGEPLPGGWHKVVKKTRTGWILHFECDRAITRLRVKPPNYRVSYDKIRRSLIFINLNRVETKGNILVYQ